MDLGSVIIDCGDTTL